MKILIVEDDLDNVAAAREAACLHAEHEYTFVKTGSEGLSLVEAADGVITDFLLPREEKIDHHFIQYLSEIGTHSPAYQIVKEVRNQGIDQAIQDLKRNDTGVNRELNHLRGYGGSILIRAFERNILCVLFTNIHRHASPETTSFYGQVMFMPLITHGIVSPHEIEDTKGVHFLSRKWKEDEEYWEEAISMVLAQAAVS